MNNLKNDTIVCVKQSAMIVTLLVMIFSNNSWAVEPNQRSQISGSLNIKLNVGKINNILVNTSSSKGRVNVGYIKQSNITGKVKLDRINVGAIENRLENARNSSAKVMVGVIKNSVVKDANIAVDIKNIKNTVLGGSNNHAIVRAGVIENSRVKNRVDIDVSVSKSITNTIRGGNGNRSEVSLGVIIDDDDDDGENENENENRNRNNQENLNQPSRKNPVVRLVAQKSNIEQGSPVAVVSPVNYAQSRDDRSAVYKAVYQVDPEYYQYALTINRKSAIELHKLLQSKDVSRTFVYLAQLSQYLPNKRKYRGVYEKYLLNMYYADPSRNAIDYNKLNKAITKLIYNNKKYLNYIKREKRSHYQIWSPGGYPGLIKNMKKNDPFYNLNRLQNTVKVTKYKGIYKGVGKLWKVESFAASKKSEYIIKSVIQAKVKADLKAFERYHQYHVKRMYKMAKDKALKKQLKDNVKSMGKIGDMMQEVRRPNPAGIATSIYKTFAEGVDVYGKTGDLELAMQVTLKGGAVVASEIAGTAGFITVLKNVRKVSKVSKAGAAAGLVAGYLLGLGVNLWISSYEKDIKSMIGEMGYVDSVKLSQFRKEELLKQLRKVFGSSDKSGVSKKLSEQDLNYFINNFKKYRGNSKYPDYLFKGLDRIWNDKYAPANTI